MNFKFTDQKGSIPGYKKIVVVSDTHSYNDIMETLKEQHTDAYAFVHCGDLEDDPIYYDGWVIVRGNNDFYGQFKDKATFKVDKHRIYVEHSHRCPYTQREEALAHKAKRCFCDIVCYGHTHRSFCEMVNGVLVLNPGSTWWPRDGKDPSYALLYVGKEDCLVNIIFEPDWN